MQQKIVFIGGPGTGKTTILNTLKKEGYTCMPEVSREITLQAKKDGITQLFLTNPLLFSEKLLEGREKQFLDAQKNTAEIIFFDRGIPSIHAYMRYFKTNFPPTFIKKSEVYKYTKVFQFLPWETIYKSDNERYETFKESVLISSFIHKAYLELGYQIINVPFGTVEDRYRFILDNI